MTQASTQREATPLAPTELRLLPLGTGSILMRGGRSASAYLLESCGQRTLIDCGPGTLLRLQQALIDPASIDHVVLSHFHPDHHADLLGLLFLRVNPSLEAKRDLVLHGPPGLARILDAWESVYGQWVKHPRSQVNEFEPGATAVGDLRFTAYRAAHTLPAYCYRIEVVERGAAHERGPTLAYSGDSAICDEVVAACLDVDFAWLECSFPDEASDDAKHGHMTPRDLVEVAERARPKRIAATHFYPPMFALLADEERRRAAFAAIATRVEFLQDLVPLVVASTAEAGEREEGSP